MSSVPLRIAYFGLPLGALALAAAQLRCCVIALGHVDAPGARRVRRTLSRNTLVLGRPDLHDARTRELVWAARPDVLLSWFWPKQIPESILALAPRGAFGVHPSLLPRWRGPDPYFWAIEAGDAVTGVTLHRLARDYDTGNVIAQRTLAIAPSDSAWRLARRLDTPGLALLVEAAQALARGEALPGEPQDEARCTLAPQPGEELLELDWHAPADALVRRVRALSPYPGAATVLGEEQVEVLAARRFEGRLPRVLEPGEAVLSDQGVVIRCGDAGVLIERVRSEPGELLRGAEVARLFPNALFRLPGGAR